MNDSATQLSLETAETGDEWEEYILSTKQLLSLHDSYFPLNPESYWLKVTFSFNTYNRSTHLLITEWEYRKERSLTLP